MRLIDADALKVDMEEKVFCGDGTYKVFGYSVHQIDDAPSITSPPNVPLTLEELRGMDGEPVWIHSFSAVQRKTKIACWAIVETIGHANATFLKAGVNCRTTKWFANYGQTWLAYSRKPEENT